MHQMDDSAFTASNQVTSRKTVLCTRTVPSAGNVPTRCPSKQQGNKPNHEGHEFQEESRGSHETHREEWKRSQDQPQFSYKNNRCLHCAGDHQSRDCPMRQQQATTTSNPASGTGIYQNTSQFLNASLPHGSHNFHKIFNICPQHQSHRSTHN